MDDWRNELSALKTVLESYGFEIEQLTRKKWRALCLAKAYKGSLSDVAHIYGFKPKFIFFVFGHQSGRCWGWKIWTVQDYCAFHHLFDEAYYKHYGQQLNRNPYPNLGC